MSCESLNQQAINLNVSFGSLPEGFCPISMQELGAAIAARLIISPNQAFTSFAIGSLEPSSNIGPWLKDCEQWFIFDDALSKYVPESQNFNSFRVFEADGNFTVPENTYNIRVEAWGAGGAGGDKSGGSGGAGGGSGGYGFKLFAVTPSQSIAIAVGVGGTNGAPGTNGTASSVLTLSAGGGTGGAGASPSAIGGTGGVVTGADIAINGSSGESADNNAAGAIGGAGGGAPNGGGGGKCSVTAAQLIGVLPGGGGAGGANAFTGNGGVGAKGRVIVWW